MECVQSATQTCGDGFAAFILSQLIGTLLTSQCSISSKYPPDKASNHLERYDFIVVGAGSAGSALAASLSENPDWTVLLIEAGHDPLHTSDIPGFIYPLKNSEQDWDYKTERQTKACKSQMNDQCVWTKGKALGGSSTVNYMIYQTGNENDYDEWERMGNPGWGWSSVKKYFEDFYPIHTSTVKDMDPFTALLTATIQTAGEQFDIPKITEDVLRTNGTLGYYISHQTIKDGVRNSASKIFLSPLINRKNLHIIKNAHVGKVIINAETKTAEGVIVWLNQKWEKIYANKEVVLSAGSISSPQILMLSGIGPKGYLESFSINAHVDLPVGKNLQDHLMLFGIYHSVLKSKPIQAPPTAILDYTYEYFAKKSGPFSNLGVLRLVGFINTKNDSKYPDIQLHHTSFLANDNLVMSQMLPARKTKPSIQRAMYKANKNQNLVVQVPVLMKPKSKGEILLRSLDPFEFPSIEPNYFEDPEDMETFLRAIDHAIKMGETEAFKNIEAELVHFDIPECDQFPFRSREYWICYISFFGVTTFHPSGTVKMAPGDDGVVDARLKVKGINRLRVADLSICPNIVSGNTNAAGIMIGQRAGDIIKEDWSNSNDRRRKMSDEL